MEAEDHWRRLERMYQRAPVNELVATGSGTFMRSRIRISLSEVPAYGEPFEV